MGLALDHGHQRQHGQHRPGTTTPARAAPRAHGPAGARHYLVQAPGSATHYRRTAVAPLQAAPVGPARAQRRGRALTWCRLGTSPAQNPAGPQLGTTGKPLPGPGAPPQGLHRPPAGDNATRSGAPKQHRRGADWAGVMGPQETPIAPNSCNVQGKPKAAKGSRQGQPKRRERRSQ